MRLRSKRLLLNHHPFTGDGVSLYATIGTAVQYRDLCLPRGAWLKGTSGVFDFGATSVEKTARVASAASPAESIEYEFPAEFASQVVSLDVRRYKDDVENETDNYRAQTVTLDADRNIVRSIDGTATLLSYEARDAGVVRIRFVYVQALSGVQPVTFAAIRTAGPTSPADASATFSSGQRIYEIDTPALSDVSAYTYKIRAINGSTTIDILTGISLQADATGPPAPSSGSASAW